MSDQRPPVAAQRAPAPSDGPAFAIGPPPRRTARPALRRGIESAFGSAQVAVRRRGFWASWAGIIATGLVSSIIVALLVGWVLLWVEREGVTSIVLLTVGSMGFALVLAALMFLLLGIRRRTRLHHAEAAFLAAVSHHLKTPLAGIRAAAQTLKLPGIPEERSTVLLDAIVGESDRLERLVNNVLEIGRVEVGSHAFKHIPLDLKELLATTIADRNRSAQQVIWTEPTDFTGPHPIEGDATSLRLALDNLIDNALAYAGDGPPDVRITLHRTEHWSCVRIADRGVGFPPEHAPQLFRRFLRGDAGGRGTGLGLPLTAAIAQIHGAVVRLTSEGVGRGATAEFWLPAAPGPAK